MSFPIHYEADLPASRSRVTVFFRLLLVIPHLFLSIVFGIGAFFAVLIAWFAILFTGRWPAGLYGFVRGAVQYFTRVTGYLWLQTDDYPPFDTGDHPEYPVRLRVPEDAGEQNRLTVLFRIVLFIPVYVILYVLSIVLELVGLAVWVVAVITARTPEGLHNTMRFLVGYQARAQAYGALLTDKWPPISDDAAAPAAPGSLAPPPPPPPPPTPTTAPDAPSAAPPPPPPPPPVPAPSSGVPDAPPPPPPPPPAQDDPPGGPFGPS